MNVYFPGALLSLHKYFFFPHPPHLFPEVVDLYRAIIGGGTLSASSRSLRANSALTSSRLFGSPFCCPFEGVEEVPGLLLFV